MTTIATVLTDAISGSWFAFSLLLLFLFLLLLLLHTCERSFLPHATRRREENVRREEKNRWPSAQLCVLLACIGATVSHRVFMCMHFIYFTNWIMWQRIYRMPVLLLFTIFDKLNCFSRQLFSPSLSLLVPAIAVSDWWRCVGCLVCLGASVEWEEKRQKKREEKRKRREIEAVCV